MAKLQRLFASVNLYQSFMNNHDLVPQGSTAAVMHVSQLMKTLGSKNGVVKTHGRKWQKGMCFEGRSVLQLLADAPPASCPHTSSVK